MLSTRFYIIRECTVIRRYLLQNKWTPLHFAVQNDDTPVVETLIRLGADVNAVTNVSY